MTQIVYLEPKSLFPGQVRSDTLFGGICIGYKEVFGVEALTEFIEKKPVLLSSTFPFVRSGKIEHFLPKLITKSAKLAPKEIAEVKRLKRARFIHETLFNDLINGKTSEKDLIQRLVDHEIADTLLFPKGLSADFSIKSLDRTHNQRNRLNPRETSFFHTRNHSFRNAGLYFLLKCLDETFKDPLRAVLTYLSDRGFGGNISIGEGQFKLSIKEGSPIKEPNDGQYFATLSLYCPTGKEIESFEKEKMWYELIKREGKMSGGKTKQGVFMFKEGSTFPLLDQAQYGKIVTVSENPAALEFGLAFPVKVRLNEV